MRFVADKKQVKITGRTLFIDQTRYLGYSGSSVSFTFIGKKASARIWSNAEDWGDELRGRIAVYVNGEEEPRKRICLDKTEADYCLYESDEESQVTITVMKYSETPFGKCGIRYFEIDTDKLCEAPRAKQRKMEIIGDSITCGYGVEAPNELTPFHTATENPTKSYSLMTAKALDADVNLISWSGNGIISGYVEETATKPSDDLLMPVVYRYTDIATSMKLYEKEEEKWEEWDFAEYTPDLILINLGTNDCSWCKDIQERRNQYKEKYKEFLSYVREHNVEAEILCLLGTMDQRVIRELQEAVEEFSKEQKDEHVHFLELPAQNPADGYGADYHPSPITHIKDTERVVKTIREIMSW